MRRLLLCMGAAALALWAAGCHKGQVRLQVAAGGPRHQWRALLGVEQFRQPVADLLYLVEPPVGYASARQQPLEGFVLNARLRWNDAVRPLSRHFDLLCEQHNQARVTVQEFTKRSEALVEALRQVTEDRREFEEALDAHRAAESAAAQAQAGQTGSGEDAIERARAEMQAARQKADALIERSAERVTKLGRATDEDEVAARLGMPRAVPAHLAGPAAGALSAGRREPAC